ncbi:MAG: 1-acyl-sn-glycerol-3-phosphate acyltransferase [Myxococcales bacterium]|nr:1-acyl-sn-glycerol-3-phosphate acyltransferase [Myxococcales bacterium]MDH5305735.1 1-acyl-sn-glycerol-3-phosphate acyltransferase [Myxococcales bacterium]MDH5566182.1 1-acyl-sn-glycerol-3-phosphate acyltransferase [Myxococcales bacterium]
MQARASFTLPTGVRLRVDIQRGVARLLSPLTTFAVVALLRFWLRLSVENHAELRQAYQRIRGESKAPLLICANHLTMIDSALIAWALAGPGWYLLHYDALPWNVPERRNFASTLPRRFLAYVYKCMPIVRGGSREQLAETLARFAHLLVRGEVGLLFPEGGRSRTGRVDPDNAAYGVGRIVRSIPGCRVLCVYLRGDRQESYSVAPARGDRLCVSLAFVEAKSDHPGLRGSRDVARQIVARLAEMEREYFDARQ